MALQIFLPFGNHLANIIRFAEGDRRELSYSNRLIASYHGSIVAIRIRGLSCDAPILSPNRLVNYDYYDYVGNAIGGAIRMYENSSVKLDRSRDARARFVIAELIAHCDPNVGLEVPPLVDAIFAEEMEFVEALLDRGANPMLDFLVESGARRTPYRVAQRLAEIEAERLAEDPNHPEATGKARLILEMIEAHIERFDSQ